MRGGGPMTVAERAYVDACKWGNEGAAFCVACLIREEADDRPPFFVPQAAHEFHHFVRGVRVGHLWGVGLCQHHHRGVPLDGWTSPAMRRHFGPSLMDGSKAFHAAYGSDAELLQRQDDELRDRGIDPPVRPENRRWAA